MKLKPCFVWFGVKLLMKLYYKIPCKVRTIKKKMYYVVEKEILLVLTSYGEAYKTA